MNVTLPPSLVGAPLSTIEVFLFCYEHEGEDWTVTAIAKEVSRPQPNTSNNMTSLGNSGLVARHGRTLCLGGELPEETFWVSVPDVLVGKSLGLIQTYNWLVREAQARGLPLELKLQDLAEQFSFSRQRAGQRLSSLRGFGLIEYSARCGNGNGITIISVG